MRRIDGCPTQSYDFLADDHPRASARKRPPTTSAWNSPAPSIYARDGDHSMEYVSIEVSEVNVSGVEDDNASWLSVHTNSLSIDVTGLTHIKPLEQTKKILRSEHLTSGAAPVSQKNHLFQSALGNGS